MDWSEIFEKDLYKYVCGMSYDQYINTSAKKIISKIPEGVVKILSIGCGNGDIELLISQQRPDLDIVLYDIHDAAKQKHPDLKFVSELPDEEFDFVYAFGSVFATIPFEDKQQFIDEAAARVKEDGTLYICLGHTKFCRPCKSTVYNIEDKIVGQSTTSLSSSPYTVTTHIWGYTQINNTYYPGGPNEYFKRHSNRIKLVT